MVCMTDNKLILCVNRNAPGWKMWNHNFSFWTWRALFLTLWHGVLWYERDL